MSEYFKLKEVFEYKGKVCAIVETNILGIAHNGYVEYPEPKKKETKELPSSKRKIDVSYDKIMEEYDNRGKGLNVELTFGDRLDITYDDPRLKDKFFVGFDTLHIWNERNPYSKTFEAVKEETKKLCDILYS